MATAKMQKSEYSFQMHPIETSENLYTLIGLILAILLFLLIAANFVLSAKTKRVFPLAFVINQLQIIALIPLYPLRFSGIVQQFFKPM